MSWNDLKKATQERPQYTALWNTLKSVRKTRTVLKRVAFFPNERQIQPILGDDRGNYSRDHRDSLVYNDYKHCSFSLIFGQVMANQNRIEGVWQTYRWQWVGEKRSTQEVLVEIFNIIGHKNHFRYQICQF